MISRPGRQATLALLVTSLCTAPAAIAHPEGAHVHGAAQAAVVIDGDGVSVSLNSAMYNITGFERAPKSDEEAAALASAITTLEDGAALFDFNAQAACRLASATHSLPEDAAVEDADQDAAHNPYRDLEADYFFACDAPERLDGLRVGLFGPFTNLQTVDMVVIDASGQSASTLTPEQPSVRLNAR